jgi:hypothetical protein
VCVWGGGGRGWLHRRSVVCTQSATTTRVRHGNRGAEGSTRDALPHIPKTMNCVEWCAHEMWVQGSGFRVQGSGFMVRVWEGRGGVVRQKWPPPPPPLPTSHHPHTHKVYQTQVPTNPYVRNKYARAHAHTPHATTHVHTSSLPPCCSHHSHPRGLHKACPARCELPAPSAPSARGGTGTQLRDPDPPTRTADSSLNCAAPARWGKCTCCCIKDGTRTRTRTATHTDTDTTRCVALGTTQQGERVARL